MKLIALPALVALCVFFLFMAACSGFGPGLKAGLDGDPAAQVSAKDTGYGPGYMVGTAAAIIVGFLTHGAITQSTIKAAITGLTQSAPVAAAPAADPTAPAPGKAAS